MKKIKLCVILVALLLGVLVVFGVAGCGPDMGAFYTLQEAYDGGFLTKDDLETIAYYLNEGIAYPEALDSRTDQAIREAAAYDLRQHVQALSQRETR